MFGPQPLANQATLAQSAGAFTPRTGPFPRPIFPQPGMQPQFGQQQQLPPWLQAFMGGFGGMAPGMQQGAPPSPQGGFQGMPGGGMPGGFGAWQGSPMAPQPGGPPGMMHAMPFNPQGGLAVPQMPQQQGGPPGMMHTMPFQPGVGAQGFGAQPGGFGGGYGSMNPQMMHPMPVIPQRSSAASFY